MKKIIAILIFVVLCSCSGSKTKTTDSERRSISDSLSNETYPVSTPEEDDPFIEHVVMLSPKEIKKRIGKAQPESVRDFFLLLPDSITLSLPFEARVRMLKQGERYNGTIKVGTCDEKHNFLNLSGYEGRWEMFVKTPGSKYVEASDNEDVNVASWDILVYQEQCAPKCHVVRAATYFYRNGVIEEFTGALINGYQDYWLEMFLNRDKFSGEEWEKLDKYFHEQEIELFFDLPRDGKTISMYIDKTIFDNFELPDEYFKVEKTEITE